MSGVDTERCLKAACRKCEDLCKSRSQIVPGYGNALSQTMIVGLAPGRYGADVSGVPFTRDASGRLLQQALIDAGLSRETSPEVEHPRLDVFITNLVKCNPRDSKGRNRNPTAKEIDNCWEYFLDEIAWVSPTYVIAAGKIVFETLYQRLIDQNGLYPSGISPSIVYVHHPAYAIRGGAGLLRRSEYSAYVNAKFNECGLLISKIEGG